MQETGNEEIHLHTDIYKEDVGEYLRDEGTDDQIRIDELKKNTIAESDETETSDDEEIDQSNSEEEEDYNSLRNEKRYSLREKKQKKRLIQDPDPDQDVNKTEEFFNCRKCEREFQTKTSLNLHSYYCVVKPKLNTFKCSLCNETFHTNTELKDHKHIHRDKHNFFCVPCKQAFSDHCDYLVHNARHLRGYKVHCNECDEYILKTSYKKHIQQHFERLHKCDICDKFFNGYFNYKSHLKMHMTQFKCGECGKILKKKTSFRHHMASHTGYKPYQCLYCGKGFVTDTNRVTHMKLHVTTLAERRRKSGRGRGRGAANSNSST